MTILHVITGLQKAAGTTTFVENVVREQRTLGHTVEVVTNADIHKLTTNDYQLTTKSDNSTLHLHLQSTPTIFHLHGLWSPLLHRAARFARNHHIPIVWSTHGMTAPWSLHHKWWKKCLPWYLYQLPDLRSAALIHCTTDLEADWNKALGFTNTFIAPLGTTLPRERSRSEVEVDSGIKTLLYVGRVYPVKALDNAIRAVAMMKQPIKLRIVGPDQSNHMSELMSLCDSLHLPYTKPGEDNSTLQLQLETTTKLVQFAGPKYDDELSAEYDKCDGLILVSHTENFGATVVDAMAHGKPVITSTKTPWKIVADKGCGWWVDNSPESLARTFTQMLDCTDAKLRAMGANGLALVKQSYTWPAIARNLVAHYEKISKG